MPDDRLTRRQTVPVRIALVLLVALIDAVLWFATIPRPVFGLLDECGHLTTAALLLGAVQPYRAYRREFLAAALALSVLIDVDHIPGELFGSRALSGGTVRPHGHTLLCVLVLALIAGGLRAVAERGIRPRRAGLVLAGAAVGVPLHLVRDLATGGASLLWPVSDVAIWYPYPLYLVLLVCCALWPAMAISGADGRTAGLGTGARPSEGRHGSGPVTPAGGRP